MVHLSMLSFNSNGTSQHALLLQRNGASQHALLLHSNGTYQHGLLLHSNGASQHALLLHSNGTSKHDLLAASAFHSFLCHIRFSRLRFFAQFMLIISFFPSHHSC